MTFAELQARKAKLIEYIQEEVYNEEILSRFETVVTELEGGFPSDNFPENYPFAPSPEELKKRIEQVLEDDRNGLFIDGPTFFAELRAEMAAERKERKEAHRL